MAEGDRFNLLAANYMPLAGGVNYQPDFGFGGTPLQGQNPLLSFGLQQLAGNLMGRVGMAPMGLNDRNVFDTLQNQRFFRMQQDLQRQAAELDRDSWQNTMRGIAHLTGTPWGAEQIQAARGISGAMAYAAPYLTQMAPEVMDEMSGYRGSAAVMAGRMMMAGRYRIDPVTGRMGQDANQVFAQAKDLYQDMYVTGAGRETGGLSAGQMGQMFEQLSMRGLMPGSRGPGAALRGLGDTDPRFIRDAATRLHLDIPNVNELSADNIDKLRLDPEVGKRLQSMDSGKVKESLKSYIDAVNAVKDIFGDMGKPNAPMAELIGSLQALTNGSITQIQPGELNMMVRMTHQLAQSTGVGLDNAMMLQADASARAVQMGLPSVFGVQAMQGGLAFGAAYRSQGLPAAWGRMDDAQMTQLDTSMRVNAAASRSALRMGLAVRLGETLNIDPKSEAGQYIAAMKNAQTTGIDTWGAANRPLNLSQADFTQLMTSTGQINEGQLNTMMTQKFAAQEYIQRYNLGDVARRAQGQSDMIPWLGQNLAGFLQTQMRGSMLNAGASKAEMATADKQAREAAARVSQKLAQDIIGMSPEDFANTATRRKIISKSMQDALEGTDAGKQLAATLGDKTGNFYNAMGESFYGFASAAIAQDPNFAYMQNLQNFYTAANPQTQQAAVRITQEQRLNASIRTALAPLNRGSMMRRAMGFLQNLNEDATADNSVVWRGVSTALGGIDTGEVQRRLAGPATQVNKSRARLESLESQMMAETDPAKYRALATQFTDELTTLNAHVAAVQEATSSMGVVDEQLGIGDTTRALNLTAPVNAVNGRIITAPTDRAGLAAFWGTDDGKFYAAQMQARVDSSQDVAMKLLTSSGSISRFGIAGINQAQAITGANRSLLELAATYTGGDVAKLQTGDFDARNKDAVMKQVAGLNASSKAALQSLYGMQQLTGKAAWGDNGAMAAELNKQKSWWDLPVTKAEVDAAATMSPGDFKNSRVYRFLQQRGSAAAADGTADAQTAANEFLAKYGVSTGDDNPLLQKIGEELVGTSQGKALMHGLMEGEDRLTKIAKAGGLSGDIKGVDQLYKAYTSVLQGGSAADFKKKFKLSDDQYQKFEQDMRLQMESGFIKFGESGEGQRTDASLETADRYLSAQLTSGKLAGADAMPHDMEMRISGTLDIPGIGQGKVDASGTANAASKEHAVTAGPSTTGTPWR